MVRQRQSSPLISTTVGSRWSRRIVLALHSRPLFPQPTVRPCLARHPHRQATGTPASTGGPKQSSSPPPTAVARTHHYHHNNSHALSSSSHLSFLHQQLSLTRDLLSPPNPSIINTICSVRIWEHRVIAASDSIFRTSHCRRRCLHHEGSSPHCRSCPARLGPRRSPQDEAQEDPSR